MQKTNFLQSNPASNTVIDGIHYNTETEPKVLMAQERARTKFDLNEMTNYVYGGKELAEKTLQFMKTVETDPTYKNDDIYDLPMDTARQYTFSKVGRATQYLLSSKDEKEMEIRRPVLALADLAAGTRLNVHTSLFLKGLLGAATEKQVAYWADQGAFVLKRFYGCFGMTELGHGSNVAGVETTATFDETSDEFVINTPHVAASKWWIGGAAHSATHSLVYARLIVKGKFYGVKQFVVPLRNVNDHTLLPGVSVGDIGKKMGRDGVDNGWIQFNNARIPRQYMCMKYDKVDRHGNVKLTPFPQLSYGALIGGRVMMTQESSTLSIRFLTIAIRYAAVRRQFASSGDVETKLLDYQYHQRRLMPRLAYAYAIRSAGRILSEFHQNALKKLADANESANSAQLNSAILEVKELFSLSAGLKAFCTWASVEIIDECRQACGGQGYSAYNGFGPGYNDVAVQCTWEGDNNVLTLSAGRNLIQTANQILKGGQPGKAVSYLAKYQNGTTAKLGSRDIRDRAVIEEAWESVASNAIFKAADRFRKIVAQGASPSKAFEDLSQLRFVAAKLHTRQFLVKAFYSHVQNAAPSLQPVLTDLANLFSLWSIEQDMTYFLKAGFFSADDTDNITELVDEYCLKVRDQAIGLTDAFGLSDFFLNSVIGKYDGDVYNNILNNAKSKDKNWRNNSKPPYYDNVVKPFLNRVDPVESSKLVIDEDLQ